MQRVVEESARTGPKYSKKLVTGMRVIARPLCTAIRDCASCSDGGGTANCPLERLAPPHQKEAAMPHILIFLLGAAAAAVAKVIGAPIARPVAKGVIKGGIKVGRQVQEWAAEVTEDLQDVAAEATAELGDQPKPRRPKATKA